jgi:hypothetical protein
MNMLRFTIYALAALALAGCTFDDATRCKDYGFTPGTDAFAGCMQNEAMRTQQTIQSITTNNQRSMDNAASGVYGSH